MKKRIVLILTILAIFLIVSFFVYQSKTQNFILYDKYKEYDDEFIDKYQMKILKSYEEYLEFISQVNEKEVLNKDNFKNEYYAIIFFGPSCNVKLNGIREIEYKDDISVKIGVDYQDSNCLEQYKIMLIPLSKSKIDNQTEIKCVYITENDNNWLY